jgi:ParB/Sulfiredoxin domain
MAKAKTAKRKANGHAEVVWSGAEDLRALLQPLEALVPDPQNPRSHDEERGVTALKESLTRFGQRKPVVLNRRTGLLEAGHGLRLAASQLGWSHLAAVGVEDDDLQALSYNVLDNRSAELSGWKWLVLGDVLRQVQGTDEPASLLFLGFSEQELHPILNITSLTHPNDVGIFKRGELEATVRLTTEQMQVVRRAIDLVKTAESDQDMLDGRALELICADYLAGADPVPES